MGELAVQHRESINPDISELSLVFSRNPLYVERHSPMICSSAVNRRKIAYAYYPKDNEVRKPEQQVEKTENVYSPIEEYQRWLLYLSNLTTDPIFLDEEFARKVKIVWAMLVSNLGINVPPPTAGPGGELGFQFVWNRSRYYLEVEIAPDGRFDWFFTDRHTNKSLGTKEDELLVEPTEELLRSLARVSVSDD
ncbi:MAG: hypothetical protein GY847_20340 [Proteobacteria bacterium]|nr:hypothetical protein [Pseudomonadota bacterium]